MEKPINNVRRRTYIHIGSGDRPNDFKRFSINCLDADYDNIEST
jgi:hypothetical protein